MNAKLDSASQQEKYEINAQKAELAIRIDKIWFKILNAGQVRLQSKKMRQSTMVRDESGFLSINEGDISRGAFDIDDNFLGHYEMKNNKPRDSHLVKGVIPDYIKDRPLEDKLAFLDDEQSEDNIQMNLLDEDSYIEGDSLSYLDAEQRKDVMLNKRISLLLRNESEGLTKKNSIKSNAQDYDFSTPATPAMGKKNSNLLTTPKYSENEKLLDALDDMDDNLIEGSFNFSFARISMLDINDRNSVVHGPSFKGNRETMERISMRRSSKIGKKIC